MSPSFQCNRNSVICGLHSLPPFMWISLQKSQQLTFSNLVFPLRMERWYWKFASCTRTLKIIWGFHTKLTESTSRVGRLRNEEDKNSSAVDGSILKSFLNKGCPLKEEKRGSGTESVSPCRVWADLWLHKGRSCQNSGKDLFRQACGCTPAAIGQILS